MGYELKICKNGNLRSSKVELSYYIQQFNTKKYPLGFNRGSSYLDQSDKIEFCNFLNNNSNFSSVTIRK